MKILLLLAIFCAVSYASISPQWTVVNKDYATQYFNWTEVTAQSPPVKGEWTTINYCGVANHTFLNYTYFSYEIGTKKNNQQKVVSKGGTVSIQDDKVTFAGVADCEYFSFKVPQFDGSTLYVVINLYAYDRSDNPYSHYQSSVEIVFDI